MNNKYETGSRNTVIANMLEYAIRDQESLIDAITTPFHEPDTVTKKAINHAKKSIRDFKKLANEIKEK